MSADIVPFPKKDRAPERQKQQERVEDSQQEVLRKVRAAAVDNQAKFRQGDAVAAAQAVDALIRTWRH